MDKNTVLTIIELFISIVVEGFILAAVFQWIQSKTQAKNEQQLKEEMQNLEKQNKFDFEQLQAEIRTTKTEIISEIKEALGKQKGN